MHGTIILENILSGHVIYIWICFKYIIYVISFEPLIFLGVVSLGMFPLSYPDNTRISRILEIISKAHGG